MAYNRVHLDGTLGSGLERWSTSIAFQDSQGDAVTDPDDLGEWAENVRGLFAATSTWGTALKGLWGSSTNLTQVRIYSYLVPGGAATGLGVSTGGNVAGSGSITFPFQSALVFTLGTNRPGRSFRGRSYWPILTGTLSSTGQYSNTAGILTTAQAFRDMLAAVAGQSTGTGVMRPVIASASEGTVTAVTSVRLGNIIDTQRRRRGDLPETFQAVPYPA